MRESAFIKKNKEKWQRFYKIFNDNDTDHTRELSELYIEITDDLAYAQTFYPKSKTKKYLNELAVQVYHLIYKNKKEDKNRIKHFWLTELPLLFFQSRFEIKLAFIIFAFAVFLGFIASVHDPELLRSVMGDAYVAMTEKNISSNDPMAVYKKMHQVDMLFFITFNNIMVSFNAFVGGALFGYLSLKILIQNGIMLGAFHYLFYSKGLLGEMLVSVWIHGTFEIIAIIIGSAAGFVLARSIISPQALSRVESFKRAAKKGAKIIIGLVPFFIMAGVLESFITRLTNWPDFIKLSIIFASLLISIWYFYLYPKLKFNQITKLRKYVEPTIKTTKH